MTDNTALDFWRWWTTAGSTHINPVKSRMIELPDKISSPKEIISACNEVQVGEPLEILVRNTAHFRKNPRIRFKMCGLEVPYGAIYKINRKLYVTGPELLFLRMAKRLQLTDLILLGYELSGTYVRSTAMETGFLQHETPLTNTHSIGRFLEKCEKFKGLKSAKYALKWVLSGAASPREAELAALFIMPKKLGGFALPKPCLNYKIKAQNTGEMHQIAKTPTVDIAWPDQHIVVEYDSSQWHDSTARLEKDSIRRNAIKQLGFEVVTITNKEFKSPSAMNDIVDGLRKRLGVRGDYQPDNFVMRNIELRRAMNLGRFQQGSNTSPGLPRP